MESINKLQIIDIQLAQWKKNQAYNKYIMTFETNEQTLVTSDPFYMGDKSEIYPGKLSSMGMCSMELV